jgi:hypothetical protein
MIKYRIRLTPEERETLLDWSRHGKRKAQDIQYAQILLHVDESEGRVPLQAAEISLRYHVSTRTVERVRANFCMSGMGIFDKQERKTRSDKKLDARVEAHLIALSCQKPPEGAPRWKLQMLADGLVELQVVDRISRMSVSKMLKKTKLSHLVKSNG